MEVRLEVAHRKANLKRVVLRGDTLIGRGSDCKLRIASSAVSRRHCHISLTDTTVLIRDLGSSNGTMVDGNPIPPNEDVELSSGSTLSIGPVKFRVRFEATEADARGERTLDFAQPTADAEDVPLDEPESEELAIPDFESAETLPDDEYDRGEFAAAESDDQIPSPDEENENSNGTSEKSKRGGIRSFFGLRRNKNAKSDTADEPEESEVPDAEFAADAEDDESPTLASPSAEEQEALPEAPSSPLVETDEQAEPSAGTDEATEDDVADFLADSESTEERQGGTDDDLSNFLNQFDEK